MTTVDIDALNQRTIEAFESPRPGDVFQEMYSFWMGVLAVFGGYVTYVTKPGHPHGDSPVQVATITVSAWRQKFSYSTPGLGYTVHLSNRGADPASWLPEVES